jgi:hypothetical protein
MHSSSGSTAGHSFVKAASKLVTPIRGAGNWQALVELRGRREVLERWLANDAFPEELQHSLRALSQEIDDQLRSFALLSE